MRLGPFLKGLIVLAATIVLTLPSVGTADPEPPYEVFGIVGDQKIPIEVGSVIYEGERVGGACSFDRRIGVEVEVLGEVAGPAVTWLIDNSCDVIITSIGPVLPGVGEAPILGTSAEPTPIATEEGGE